jgi:hypothetical protein
VSFETLRCRSDFPMTDAISHKSPNVAVERRVFQRPLPPFVGQRAVRLLLC